MESYERFRDVHVTCNGPIFEAKLTLRSRAVADFARLCADTLYLSIGTVCNQACLNCLNGSHRRTFATLHDLCESLRLASGLGLRKVALVGGEPTIRKDLPSIVACARDLGFHPVLVMTNGLVLSIDGQVRRLVDAGLTHVQVSFDDVDPATLCHLSRNDRAGSLLFDAIEKLMGEPRLSTHLYAVIVRQNLPRLADIVRFARRLEERFVGREVPVVFTLVKAQGSAMENRDLLVPRASAVAGALREVASVSEQVGGRVIVRNVPLCLMADRGRSSMDGLFSRVRLNLETGQSEPSEEQEATRDPAVCGPCAESALCPGVFADYSAEFGWDEFRPFPQR